MTGMDKSNRKPEEWDEALDQRPYRDERGRGWDERDGSKEAAFGALVFFVIFMLSILLFAVVDGTKG